MAGIFIVGIWSLNGSRIEEVIFKVHFSSRERFLTHGAEVVFPGVEKLPVDTPLRGYCNGKFLGIAKSNGEAVHICTFLGEDNNE